MKSYAEEHNIMALPRSSLIRSMKGEKILLATPLLKWYLGYGLEVTRVHQVVEFTPEPCFKHFGDAVSIARRAGDVDPRKAIIADTMKLVGFFVSFFGDYRGGEVYFFRIKNPFLLNLHFFFFFCFKVGNSGYGKTITNQLKHRNVEYCSDAEACRKVNTPRFRNLTVLPRRHMK